MKELVRFIFVVISIFEPSAETTYFRVVAPIFGDTDERWPSWSF